MAGPDNVAVWVLCQPASGSRQAGRSAAPGAEDQHVLHGGEEYELLIIASDLPKSIDGISLTRIGEIIDSAIENQAFLIDDARESVLMPRGWQHFA